MKPDSGHEKAAHPTFDELKALHDIAWTSFTERREFEWRVALGLWTALAAFTSLSLGKDVQLKGTAPVICAVVVSVVLFGLHLFFIAGIVRGNKVDRAMSHHYAEEMRRLAGSPLPQALQAKAASHQRQTGLRSYAHVFQLGVTLVLCLTAVVAVLWKAH